MHRMLSICFFAIVLTVVGATTISIARQGADGAPAGISRPAKDVTGSELVAPAAGLRDGQSGDDLWPWRFVP